MVPVSILPPSEEGICWTRTAERQTSRLRMEYLKSVLRQEVGFFDTQVGSSTNFEVISAISGDAELIQDVMAEKIPNCITQLSALVFSIVVCFVLSWRLALACLPFALLFVVPVISIKSLLKSLGMKMKDAYDIGGGVAEQAISSIRTVYSYVGEQQTLDKFSHALQTSMALGIKQGLTKGLMMGSMGLVFGTWAFAFWFGGYLVTEKGESGGRAFISAICVSWQGAAMSALPNITFISEAMSATERMFEMISRVPLIDTDNDTPILQELSLKVKAGKTIGLVGSSGSGKSTIISLIERFYDPLRGDILLDGHRIKRLQLKWLRSQMGLVNQEPVLFATSIRENILFGKEGVSDEMVEIAAKAANAHNFINKLPDAYETQVGQFGIQLSGGQKQRIAIARALLKEPRILLLDEATSALDTESERVVQEALDQASVGRTTIIVAHRLTTIRKADKIVVLQLGKVIRIRSWSRLLLHQPTPTLQLCSHGGAFNQAGARKNCSKTSSRLKSDGSIKTRTRGAAVCARLATEASLISLCSWHASTPSLVLMKSMSTKAKKAQNEGTQLASEAVVNHRTITAFASQERIMRLYAATQKGPRKESIKQSWFSGKNIADAGSMSSDLSKGGGAVRPEQMILQGLSLTIEAGKTVALVGQSGSGSIRHNIIYGKEEASEAEIVKAAELANAHEFISSMKDGYETYCGERGVQLSGGQKQRVALARAILKNPAILLIGEDDGGRTCVVNCTSVINHSELDSIAVIENGKVAEQGSHSELLAMGNGFLPLSHKAATPMSIKVRFGGENPSTLLRCSQSRDRVFADMAKKNGMFHFADGIDKVLLLFGTLGCIGDGLMSPLTMVILGGVIDDYGSGDPSFSNDVVDKYALKLLILAICVAVSAFIEGICWTRTAERQTSRLRMEYLKSILRQEVGFFDTQVGSSTNFQVISAISGDAQLIQDVMAEKVFHSYSSDDMDVKFINRFAKNKRIPNCLAHLSALIFSIVVSFTLSWRLAVASLPFALLFVVPVLGIGASLKGLGMKMKEAYDKGGGVAEQAISSIRTVYSYVGERKTIDKFSHALETSMALGIKQGLTKGLMIGSMGMIFVAWAFVSWVGSYLVTEKGETGGRVFVSAICVIMAGLFDNRKGKTITSVRGEIEFRGVDFSYPSRPDTPILQKLNLKVKAGMTIGLVGGSGSGKSTIISLLERFYDPIKGDILLDGHRIKSLQLKWLRSQMGLVNQEPVLFATSIRENILFGKEGVSDEMVEIAAKAANAHNFIIKLPDAYETQVGQFGIQLSGGQKQRIAIARALLKEPRILLLDEATSALDTESERVVQEALDQASVGRTTIIVAHRLTTIRKVDKIVVLRSGKVIESGTHDELMKKNDKKEGGAYYQMVLLQQSTTQNESGSPDSQHTPIRHQTHERNFNPKEPRVRLVQDQACRTAQCPPSAR
ncbi:hypothetical protein OSB04_018652 [Centaurea solstitialis]|uniref:Uncharacterized protein n=1 Tax=Centaurea solstitialis TaxID=347529 RepID=A0AA38TNB5_9ASTR|nr:hypothetical protein OSB04_018652 [Centaurea solstitialis]